MAMGGSKDDPRGEHSSTAPPPVTLRMIGGVALDVAMTPEGRAAGLSVEVWPDRGVWLRARSGHELRVFVEDEDSGARVGWTCIEPPNEAAQASADLPADITTVDDLRTLMTRWLVARGSA